MEVIMNLDKKILDLLLKKAEKAYKKGEIPVSAVILDQSGKIISSSFNNRQNKYNVLGHAEINAIDIACKKIDSWILEGATLYVTLEPCIMCAGALGWSQIPRIVYGAGDDKRGFRRFAPQALHPRCEVVSGVLEEECATLMKSFFQKKR